jgi:hypothetical protein
MIPAHNVPAGRPTRKPSEARLASSIMPLGPTRSFEFSRHLGDPGNRVVPFSSSAAGDEPVELG